MHLPYGLALGVTAGFLEFIPVVGPAGRRRAWFWESGFSTPFPHLLWIAVFLGLWRLVQDYLISPRVMGNKVELHPLAAIVAVLMGNEIAGVIGVYSVHSGRGDAANSLGALAAHSRARKADTKELGRAAGTANRGVSKDLKRATDLHGFRGLFMSSRQKRPLSWTLSGSKSGPGSFEPNLLNVGRAPKFRSKPTSKPGGLEVVQQLCFVAPIEYACALQFDDNNGADDKVRPKYPNSLIPKLHCHCLLAFNL